MRESETTIEENRDTAISGMDLPLSDVNAGTEHKAVLEDQAGAGKERNSV